MTSQKIIGIDLGGTSAKIAVLSHEGAIEHQWSIATNTAEQGRYIVPDMIASIKEKLGDLGLDLSEFQGIGMGSPGQIDYEKGTVTGAYNLGWVSEQTIKADFEGELGLPFIIENDANVAALGEAWLGAGENAPDVIFVTLGTGVGGGIIANGQLLHGAAGSAGEIGHVPMAGNDFPCTCGNIGCLETVASATGIVTIAKSQSQDFPTDSLIRQLLQEERLTAKDIFDLAKEADPSAEKVVDTFAAYLGLACAQLANTLNPSFIVIGGGVSAAGQFLLDRVRDKFEAHAFPTVRSSTKLRLATLGNDAGVIGAASLLR